VTVRLVSLPSDPEDCSILSMPTVLEAHQTYPRCESLALPELGCSVGGMTYSEQASAAKFPVSALVSAYMVVEDEVFDAVLGNFDNPTTGMVAVIPALSGEYWPVCDTLTESRAVDHWPH
jgi:hypothetical protein